jgi:hypothetical protein
MVWMGGWDNDEMTLRSLCMDGFFALGFGLFGLDLLGKGY